MSTQPPGKKPKQKDAIERRRARLLQKISATGPVLQGTVTRRTILKDDPQAPGTQKEYGPYYQWTWKQAGKTVTVNLSASQAKAYQKAIDENRKLETLLEQLREASLNLLEETTQGVAKRKRK